MDFEEKFGREGLTFDDVLLVPGESNVMPREVVTETRLTSRIDLNIPLMSAGMDTVTEARLAIAIAREGGIGVIHKNLPVEAQAGEVDKSQTVREWCHCRSYLLITPPFGKRRFGDHGSVSYFWGANHGKWASSWHSDQS